MKKYFSEGTAFIDIASVGFDGAIPVERKKQRDALRRRFVQPTKERGGAGAFGGN